MNGIQIYEYDLVTVFKDLLTVDTVREDIHSMISVRFGRKLADFVESKLADIPTEEFIEYIRPADKDNIKEKESKSE